MKKVTITKFQTIDGKLFKDEYSAKRHEIKLEKNKLTCPHCGGSGEIKIVSLFELCHLCAGKGFIEDKPWSIASRGK